MENSEIIDKLPQEFMPATAWQVRLTSSDSIGKPCELCGTNFVRIPFEIVTSSDKVVCPLCCRRWNRLLAELIESFKQNIHEGVGEFNIPSTSITYVGGFGAITNEDLGTAFSDMFNEIASCLEKNKCSAFILINIFEKNFRGKPIVRSEISSEAAALAQDDISNILIKYSQFAKYLHYIFLWNKQKLGSIGGPILLDNFAQFLN